MFGYVIPNQQELKVRELEEYRSWYCGLCSILKKKYGIKGQLSLNYDMTFLGMLLSGLYEPKEIREKKRCLVHPATRHMVCYSEYLEYAADMNILLTYYKCKDDWKDDGNLAKASYGLLLSHSGKKVTKQYPRQSKIIEKNLQLLDRAEKSNSANLDQVSGLFGEICSELFLFQEDEWKEELTGFGFYLGKFIYLMDAWDDMEEDRQKGKYNPFLSYEMQQAPDKEKWEKQQYQILQMMMAECGRIFEKLPILENIEIFRNILYSGVWSKFYQKKAVKEGKTHK